MDKGYYTYIIRCSDRTLYTGWTINLQERLESHNSGKGAKYTRGRLPVKLVASWQFDSKSEAMSYECEIKRLSRKEKEILANQQKANF